LDPFPRREETSGNSLGLHGRFTTQIGTGAKLDDATTEFLVLPYILASSQFAGLLCADGIRIGDAGIQ
jgi:hypothetical protein